MNIEYTQDLSTQTRIWQKLEPVDAFGQRQNINCAGGISAKQLEEDLKEIYPPLCTIPTGPSASMALLTWPLDLMAMLIRTTVKETFLGRSVSKKYRQTTATPTRSRFAFLVCVRPRVLGRRGMTQVGRHSLAAATLLHIWLGVFKRWGTTRVDCHLVVVPICWEFVFLHVRPRVLRRWCMTQVGCHSLAAVAFLCIQARQFGCWNQQRMPTLQDL